MAYTPNLIDKFPMGSLTAGIEIAAGLPNSIGSFYQDVNAEHSGAITGMAYTYRRGHHPWLTNSSNHENTAGNIWLDLEYGRKYWYKNMFGVEPTDTIYGNSLTVQPPAVTVRYYIRAK